MKFMKLGQKSRRMLRKRKRSSKCSGRRMERVRAGDRDYVTEDVRREMSSQGIARREIVLKCQLYASKARGILSRQDVRREASSREHVRKEEFSQGIARRGRPSREGVHREIFSREDVHKEISSQGTGRKETPSQEIVRRERPSREGGHRAKEALN